jgi:type VI secretion system protein ImpI/type VI secretion system protein
LLPENWDDDFDASESAAAPPPAAARPREPIQDDPHDPPPPPQAPPASAPPPPSPTTPAATATPIAGGEVAARAFLRAAGVEHLGVPDAELVATMTRLGTVMRSLVAGMREVLMTRAAIKGEFRMQQTRIGAANNNPLKFSINPEQALEAMVRPAARGYLDPVAAAAEALKDIKAHEVAMISGMEAALRGLLQRLDPNALESRIETGGGLSSLLKGKKARYWEVYQKMYADIADQAEHDFQDLFSKEFARAYQDQLKKL